MNEVGQMALKWIFYGYQGFLYTWFLFRLLDCRFVGLSMMCYTLGKLDCRCYNDV